MSKYHKHINRVNVIITGISDTKQSKYGGTYRYIYAIGLDGRNLHPASLSSSMENYDAWSKPIAIVENLNPSENLFCDDAVIITRDGKTMLNCDFVPSAFDIVEIDEEKRKQLIN